MATPTITPMQTPFPDKGQSQAAFDYNVDGLMSLFDSLTTELPITIDWMQDRVNEVAATAIGGDLPDITGQATNMLRLNAAGTAAEFRTPAQVLSDIGAEPALPAGAATPTGTVIHVAMNTAPAGYIKANGTAVSRSTYAALFAAIGTTFGTGNGTTTFNVPDLRGEFVRGWDDSRSVDSGRVFGSAQADDFKAHVHGVSSGGDSNAGGTTPDLSSSIKDDTYYTESSGGVETRPRNIALLACIKY
jgi:microcystin-dependent protein